MLRVAILSVFLSLVLLVGLPFGPLQTTAETVQQTFEPLGFDVSMTPITADMTMMRDRTGRVSLYQTNPKVYALTEKGQKLIPSDELELYPFKLPLILYLEMYAFGEQIQETLWALCYTLRLKEPETRGFYVDLGLPMNSFLRRQGFQVDHKCAE